MDFTLHSRRFAPGGPLSHGQSAADTVADAVGYGDSDNDAFEHCDADVYAVRVPDENSDHDDDVFALCLTFDDAYIFADAVVYAVVFSDAVKDAVTNRVADEHALGVAVRHLLQRGRQLPDHRHDGCTWE